MDCVDLVRGIVLVSVVVVDEAVPEFEGASGVAKGAARLLTCLQPTAWQPAGRAGDS